MNYCSIGSMIFLISCGQLILSAKDQAWSSSDYGDLVQYRDGDIIIAVAIPVSRNSNGVCKNSGSVSGIQLVEEVNMIIEKVNSDDNILRGLKLGTIIINTCSLESHALNKIIFEVLRKFVINDKCDANRCAIPQAEKILAGVIGAVTSSLSIQIAMVLQAFSIPQVSYSATSHELSDKSRFKYFFRTVAPDNHQTSAMAEFIKKMNWNYVSVVYENTSYGVRGYTELIRNLKMREICVAISLSMNNEEEDREIESIVRDLLTKKEARAIILFMGTSSAEKIMYATSKVPEAYEAFTWIGSDAWVEFVPSNQASKDVRRSVSGSVGFQLKYSYPEGLENRIKNLNIESYKDETLTLNPWWPKFVSERKNCSLSHDLEKASERICSKNENISDFTTTPLSLGDAIMVFVHAIDSYYRDVCKNGSKFCDELAKTAGTNKVARDLYTYLKNVSFELSDGRLFSFDKNQDGPAAYRVTYYENGNTKTDEHINGWVNLGTYIKHAEESFSVNNISLPGKLVSTQSVCSKPCEIGQAKEVGKEICCWFCHTCNASQYVSKNGSLCVLCPLKTMPNNFRNDCMPIPVRIMDNTSTHAIVSLAVGSFGLFCTLLVFIFYVIKRNTAIVRASGKELCFFVLFGIFLTLLNSFTITATPNKITCAVSRGILSIGPASMYAGLLMKTLRIVFIFQSKRILSTRTKSYLEPLPLLLITMCVVLVQGVILIIWLILHTPGSEAKYFYNDAFLTCSYLLDIKLFVGLAYPFILTVICTILATINRNVPTGFRETLFVAFSVYTTCVTWIAFVAMFLTNYSDVPRQLTTVSVALSVSAITVLFSLFVPRCYTMIFQSGSNTAESVMSKSGSFPVSRGRKRRLTEAKGIGNLAYENKENNTM